MDSVACLEPSTVEYPDRSPFSHVHAANTFTHDLGRLAGMGAIEFVDLVRKYESRTWVPTRHA